MSKENRFGEFIANLRREKQISLEQLSDGLCDLSVLSRFERGEREPDRLLQNRILSRLGAVPENYENFLYYKDYCRWEKRQGIVHNILEENIEQAKLLAEEYKNEYDMTYPLERQFYLAMLVQIKRYEGSSKQELASLFEEALVLTVPNVKEKGLRNRVLSLEELNLLLEYMYCREEKELPEFYESLLEYITKLECTTLAMAKIYPKVVYYFYLAWKAENAERKTKPEYLLELCDKAIELLRDANRMFYLWELFCMREELVPYLPEEICIQESFLQRSKQCNDWKETLEEIYKEYHASIAMYEFCYLYVESENYCIGDVIRIRRKMLGLSQEKLSEGICDSRTVSKLERHTSKPQKEIVQQLFDRLNLSTELCRTELVTDSKEAIEKYDELKVQKMNGNYEQMKSSIEQLRGLISLDIPSNRQAIIRNEIICRYSANEIDKSEYVSQMVKTLELTVPFKAVVKQGEKYLTNEELSCIQNIMVKSDDVLIGFTECEKALVTMCYNMKYPLHYTRIYEFVLSTVSSKLGNNKEYEASDEMKRRIITLSLRTKRIKAIHGALYGILWNSVQKKSEEDDLTTEKIACELKKCINVSVLCKNAYREKKYREKLEKLKM